MARILVEHLSWIEDATGIQHLAQLAHDPHLGIASEFREELLLREADAVFPGDCAPQADRFLEDLREREFDSVHLLSVTFIGEESGMEISISHVAEGSDPQSMLCCYLGDEADHVRKFAARHGGVLQDGRRSDASEGAKGAAARAC